MTESQAWRIVAEEYDAGRVWSKFLCINLESDRDAAIAAIPSALRGTMIRRIHNALPEYAFVAYDSNVLPNESRDARILACLLFSEIAGAK